MARAVGSVPAAVRGPVHAPGFAAMPIVGWCDRHGFPWIDMFLLDPCGPSFSFFKAIRDRSDVFGKCADRGFGYARVVYLG